MMQSADLRQFDHFSTTSLAMKDGGSGGWNVPIETGLTPARAVQLAAAVK
jgi:hypothetical protein